jgi:integrase
LERRSNGEGTKIKKHSRGGFYKAITMPDGKRKFVYGKSKSLVAEKEKEARREFDEGVTQKSITLGDFLKRWLDECVKDSVSQKTWERYEQICRIHLIPEIGHVKVKDLKPLQVQGLYRRKLDSGLSPRTVQYVHVTLHKALKQAMRWGHVGRNVTKSVDSPRPEKKEINPLTPEQVGILLSGLETERDRALYTLAVSTGARQSELLGLMWKDLDLYRGAVSIRRALSKTREGYVFVSPKSAKGKRSVGLIPRAIEALESYRDGNEGLGPEDLVFPNHNGSPLASYTVSNSFTRICKRLGLPETTRFHDLRHTAATIWLLKGIHPKIVQEALGHSTITITLDTYSHVLPSMQDRAVEAMGEALEFHNNSTTV